MNKTLFVLEDNQDLLSDIEDEAKSSGWVVHAARCVEDARRLAVEKGKQARAALIDLMVPVKRDALRTLDQLLRKRMEFVLGQTHRGKKLNLSVDELLEARQGLAAIDARIQECVEPEGGRLFLAEATRDKLADDWEIVIFSARDQTKDDLGRRVMDSVPSGKMVSWLHKPVPPDELTTLLSRLAQGVGA